MNFFSLEVTPFEYMMFSLAIAWNPILLFLVSGLRLPRRSDFDHPRSFIVGFTAWLSNLIIGCILLIYMNIPLESPVIISMMIFGYYFGAVMVYGRFGLPRWLRIERL